MAEKKADVAAARAELQRGLEIFRSYENADRALAVLEGLQQNERELNERRDRANTEAEKAEADAEKRIAKIRQDENAANRRADEAKTRATETGKDILAIAEQKAKQREEEANNKIKQAEEKHAALLSTHKELDKELQQKQAELKELDGRIERARRSINELLKGAAQ